MLLVALVRAGPAHAGALQDPVAALVFCNPVGAAWSVIDGKVVVHRLDGLLDEDGDYVRDGDTELQSAWLSATSADPAAARAFVTSVRTFCSKPM